MYWKRCATWLLHTVYYYEVTFTIWIILTTNTSHCDQERVFLTFPYRRRYYELLSALTLTLNDVIDVVYCKRAMFKSHVSAMNKRVKNETEKVSFKFEYFPLVG